VRGLLPDAAPRRISQTRAEFLLVSLWDNDEAIKAFAGEDTSRAVFYPRDPEFLIEKHDYVTHYEVVFGEHRAPGEQPLIVVE
jgi:heme-degrading monooxygenase HmoA